MRSILVRDYMDKNPHAIHDTATVRDVIHSLMSAGVIGAPVVDEADCLIGFVSEQDCIKQMLNDAFYSEESHSVTSVMSRNIKTVAPDTSIVEVAEAMSSGPPKNYPVVENGKLVGLISRSLILKALLDSSNK